MKRATFSLVFVALFAAFAHLCAAQADTGPTKGAANASPNDPAAETAAWLASVPPDQRAKSDAYFEGGYWILVWDFLISAAIALFLLVSGTSAKLRDFAERTTRFKAIQVVLYVVPFLLINTLLSSPFDVYVHYFREHQYGLATQTFLPWLGEQGITLCISLVGSSIAFIILYAVFRRAPRTWWLWGTGVSILFLIVVLLIAPVWIDPLFNTYKPLTDPKISASILAMARANEIPVTQVYEFDASRQTNRVSANVAGIFGSARIALNDNLLNQCTLPEIRAVMAHEMGHYVLNHIWKLALYFSVFSLIGFAILRAVFDATVRKWGARWRVRGIADPAGLPLLMLIFSTYLFLLTPATNTVTRVTEREADAFGINTAREADGFAKVALKLGKYRKLDPGPVEEFIFFDHPSGRARIRMAMDWKAANLPAGDAGTPSSILVRRR